MTELLPCPLCKSTNVQAGSCWVGDEPTKEPAARCMDCGCRATAKAWQNRSVHLPDLPQEAPDTGLKARGVGRMFDNEKAVLVIFDRKLTDDELRSLHDQIRIQP